MANGQENLDDSVRIKEDIIDLEEDNLQEPISEPIKFTKSNRGNIQDCKCLLCDPPTFHCKGSMSSHLREKHRANRIKGKTYICMSEKIIKTRKSYGSLSGGRNVKCLIAGCEWKGSEKGIHFHLKTKHQQGQKQGINYDFTGESLPAKEGTTKRKYENHVQIPTGGYISIPIVLRIPVIFGKVEIQNDEMLDINK